MSPPLAIFTATERLISQAEERARKIARLPRKELEAGCAGEAMAIRAADHWCYPRRTPLEASRHSYGFRSLGWSLGATVPASWEAMRMGDKLPFHEQH